MDDALLWRKFLVEWPNGVPRSGVVVTSNEQIVFVEFMLSENIGLFVRRAPDTVGGRKVLLPYSKIEAIKIIEPTTAEVFAEVGFRGAKPSE